MRLFVSYARVDKPYCIQIVDTLDVHEVWYDQRLYAGQNWWKEILRRLDWCDGFIYLLSPESVQSEYCAKEFELAQSLGRHVFPVIVHPDTALPIVLKGLQYADLSKGLTAEAVKTLLNAIYIAEAQQNKPDPNGSNPNLPIKAPKVNPSTVIANAIEAMECAQYDKAVFLLKQAKENGYKSRFIDIEAVLEEAENALERQAYLREAEREYNQIVALIRHSRTSKLGCEAFQAFRADFPDYDPQNMAAQCGEKNPEPKFPAIVMEAPAYKFELPLLRWCTVPAGAVMFQYADQDKNLQTQHFQVGTFQISQYPITNDQYQHFVNDPNGYSNPRWWEFSTDAQAHRKKSPQPQPAAFQGNERPREMVSWYDALAFACWLSEQLGKEVNLPTLVEWQRAYQGDDRRLFPWGDQFDKSFCNTQESNLKMTSQVNRYAHNVSPFGVCDLAGNVWEWCTNRSFEDQFDQTIDAQGKRVVRGGSYMGPWQRARIDFHFALKPETYYSSIGFRVVMRGY